MTKKTYMLDEFNNRIEPGDSFMRVESKMGGFTKRFYFFGGYCEDKPGKVHVREYDSVPRVILDPSTRGDILIRMDSDMTRMKGLTPPDIDDVINPPKARSSI